MKSLVTLVAILTLSLSLSAQTFFGYCSATSGTSTSSVCFGLEGVSSTSGTAALNQNLRWYAGNSTIPGAPTFFVFATSLAAAPIPVPGFLGDMLLNPSINVVYTATPNHPTLGSAFSYYDFFVPNIPALIGSSLHSQALRLGLTTGGWPILSLSAAWGVTIV